jgi:hypothetical protein
MIAVSQHLAPHHRLKAMRSDEIVRSMSILLAERMPRPLQGVHS